MGMALYVVRPGGNSRVYSMTWRAWHDIWYGLTDMEWYMAWPYGNGMGHGIVYGIAW